MYYLILIYIGIVVVTCMHTYTTQILVQLYFSEILIHQNTLKSRVHAKINTRFQK